MCVFFGRDLTQVRSRDWWCFGGWFYSIVLRVTNRFQTRIIAWFSEREFCQDTNFSLFKYNNELSAEIEKLEQQIAEYKEECPPKNGRKGWFWEVVGCMLPCLFFFNVAFNMFSNVVDVFCEGAFLWDIWPKVFIPTLFDILGDNIVWV